MLVPVLELTEPANKRLQCWWVPKLVPALVPNEATHRLKRQLSINEELTPPPNKFPPRLRRRRCDAQLDDNPLKQVMRLRLLSSPEPGQQPQSRTVNPGKQSVKPKPDQLVGSDDLTEPLADSGHTHPLKGIHRSRVARDLRYKPGIFPTGRRKVVPGWEVGTRRDSR